MPGFVYILEDDVHRYYIGSTENIEKRYLAHSFRGTHTTSRMKNPKMVFMQQYVTIQDAKKIEAKLKRLKRKDYIQKIINDGYIKIKI